MTQLGIKPAIITSDCDNDIRGEYILWVNKNFSALFGSCDSVDLEIILCYVRML